jgi:hypothetical protein
VRRVDFVDFALRVTALDIEARRLLARHEASLSRSVTLEDSYARLGQLSLAQDELFRESLRAVETQLYRAAHVLGWAGFVDFLHNYLGLDKYASLNATRAKWRITGSDDLREFADYQVIEAGRDAGFYGKTVMKALHGLLNKRNECAHPTAHFPGLNETLGYMSELFNRIEFLQKNAHK